MSLDFSASIGINNLNALKAIYTFIFNYNQFEKPTYLERLMIPFIKKWVEKEALKTLKELMVNERAKQVSVSLNDVSPEVFCILYIVQNPQLIVNITAGPDLFLLMAQMSLEFTKVKHPRDGTVYTPQL